MPSLRLVPSVSMGHRRNKLKAAAQGSSATSSETTPPTTSNSVALADNVMLNGERTDKVPSRSNSRNKSNKGNKINKINYKEEQRSVQNGVSKSSAKRNVPTAAKMDCGPPSKRRKTPTNGADTYKKQKTGMHSNGQVDNDRPQQQQHVHSPPLSAEEDNDPLSGMFVTCRYASVLFACLYMCMHIWLCVQYTCTCMGQVMQISE